MTGLSLAYFLKDSNQKITLLEKGEILQQTTAKTTAKISFLQQDVYTKIKKQYGKEKSYQYYQSQKQAMSLLVDIIKQHSIACNLEEEKSILFALDPKNVQKVKDEEALLNSFHEKTKPVQDETIAYGFSVYPTYTFHPLKYLNRLLKTFSHQTEIYEQTRVEQITPLEKGYRILTNQGEITATTVAICCHYPFFLFPLLIPLKTYLKRDYVFSGKVDFKKKCTAINVDKELHSIRFYKDQVIYNCKEHLLTDLITEEDAYLKGKEQFQKLFGFSPTHSWINQDIYSHDNLPFIGKIKDSLYIATAYGAWGMTNATLAGKIIADLIQTGVNPYEALFSPKRKTLPLLLSSLIYSTPYLKGYLGPLFSKEKIQKTKINGKNYYVQVDSSGNKILTEVKCPHMKCPLLYNETDETWDCPCHGSRFTKDGKLLVGPSKRNIDLAE